MTRPFKWVWPVLSRPACLGAGLTTERSALSLGWPPAQSAELSLVIVELSTNAVRHGKDGVCTVELSAADASVEVRDKGPGFPAWVLHGFSTSALLEHARPRELKARGLGAGLDVVKRLATGLQLSNDAVVGGATARALIVRRMT